jgi:hypothetical protein
MPPPRRGDLTRFEAGDSPPERSDVAETAIPSDVGSVSARSPKVATVPR